jgi:hypothetical protein
MGAALDVPLATSQPSFFAVSSPLGKTPPPNNWSKAAFFIVGITMKIPLSAWPTMADRSGQWRPGL